MMYYSNASGDSPPRPGGSVQQPQHSTPVKSYPNGGPLTGVIFPPLGSSLPTPVHPDQKQPSPAERDVPQTSSAKPSRDPPSKDAPAQTGSNVPKGTVTDYTSRVKQVQVSTPSEAEMSMIQKQRKELQLLIGELRDRDRELNDMVAAHQTQLLAWEEDRQKLLTAEQKCGHYESEIKEYKKNLKKLAAYVKSLKTERQKQLADFQEVKDQLSKLNQENGNQSVKLTEFQMKDKNMSDNVKALSNAIGQLEAREMELTTLVKLKDKEISEAASHVGELKGRMSQMDLRCREAHELVLETQRQAKDWKHKYTELKRDHDRLRENFTSVVSQSQTSLEELEDSRRRIGDLERQLALAGERECRQTDMIESLKSKQERGAQELTTLRQLYDRQQREMSLLQLNLDSSQDIIQKQQATLNKSQSDPGLHHGNCSPRCQGAKVSSSGHNGIAPSHLGGVPTLGNHQTSQSLSHDGITSHHGGIPSSNDDPRFDGQSGTHGALSTTQDPAPTTQINQMSSGLALSSVSTLEEKETSLEEERLKFDELYMKFLQDPECPGTTDSSLMSINPEELTDTSLLTTGRDETVSPTSKLHRLLAESRLMVEKLEQSTLTQKSTPLQAVDLS